MFADALVAGFVGIYDRENNAVRYWGDGTTQIDWTTWEDTAKYLAAAALDEQPVPAKLYVAGDRASVIELAELIAAARKRPSLERLGSLDELREEIAKRLRETPSDMFAWLPLMYALGVFGGLTGLGPLANDRYPDVRPETLAEAIRRGAL